MLDIANSDVAWDGNIIGIIPRVTRQRALEALNEPDCSAPALVEALLDPDRQIVAHVLLTYLENEPWSGDGESWNGLKVQLHADASVTFEGNDLEKLHARWLRKLTSGSLIARCARRG